MDDLEERIRQRAYELWEADGRPHGRADEHWARARALVASEAENATEEGAGQGIVGGGADTIPPPGVRPVEAPAPESKPESVKPSKGKAKAAADTKPPTDGRNKKPRA